MNKGIHKPRFIELDIEKDLQRIEAIRSDSTEYRNKLITYQRLFERKRVIVVGSARDFVAPKLHSDDIVVCVNGSSHNAGKMGISVPDLTLIVGYLPSLSTDHHRATFELLDGQRTQRLTFVTGTLTLEECLTGIGKIDFRYDELEQINTYEQAAIVGSVCGEELGFGLLDERISTGVLSVALALICGAAEVVFAGVSFDNGTSYMDIPTKRLHTDTDIRFLKLCSTRGLPLSTTSKTVAKRCGLPLAARRA